MIRQQVALRVRAIARRKAGRMSAIRMGSIGAAVFVVVLAAAPLGTLGAQGNDSIKEDSAFVHQAAAAGLAEVRLGRLAHAKATNQDVKQFGQLMETDHSKANQDLDAIATAGGLSVPSKLSSEHQQAWDDLTKSGTDFDATYMSMMVKDHVEDVQRFQEEQTAATSQAVRDFVKKTLPTLEKHLAKAKQIAARIGADSTGSAEHAERDPSSR
jgi:putative membrane protein